MSDRLSDEQRVTLIRAANSAWEQGAMSVSALVADLEMTVAQMLTDARAEALRDFADSRGVNIGDEDSEWWQGYRQAQRECLRDAIDRAEEQA